MGDMHDMQTMGDMGDWGWGRSRSQAVQTSSLAWSWKLSEGFAAFPCCSVPEMQLMQQPRVEVPQLRLLVRASEHSRRLHSYQGKEASTKQEQRRGARIWGW